MTSRVGRDGETVAAVARSRSVGWWSVMRAVVDVGSRLLEADRGLDSVVGLGVDEHAWQRVRAGRRTQFATGVVGLRPDGPARLLEVTPGRSGKAYADWLSAQARAVA